MAVRWRFETSGFIRSWPSSGSIPLLERLPDRMGEGRRLGAATLALLATRREYWVALGLIAGYAQEQDQTIPRLLERLAPAGELGLAESQQIVAWASGQPFARELGEPDVVVGAVYSVASAVRPEALAAAADHGTAFQVCWDNHQPDLDRVLACYLEQVGK